MADATDKYSPELCQYIGRLEIEAFRCTNTYGRHKIFSDALSSSDSVRLSKKESGLAKRILELRLKYSAR